MGSEGGDFAFTWTTRFNELRMKQLREPCPLLACGAQFKRCPEAVVTLENSLPFHFHIAQQRAVCRKLPSQEHLYNVAISLRYLPSRSSNQGCASSAGHVILDLPLRLLSTSQPSAPATVGTSVGNLTCIAESTSLRYSTRRQDFLSPALYPGLPGSRLKLTCRYTVLFVSCEPERWTGSRLASQRGTTAPLDSARTRGTLISPSACQD